jgi:hypothetical protein
MIADSAAARRASSHDALATATCVEEPRSHRLAMATQTCLRCRAGTSSAPHGPRSARKTRERPGGPLRSTTGSLRVSSSQRLSEMSA